MIMVTKHSPVFHKSNFSASVLDIKHLSDSCRSTERTRDSPWNCFLQSIYQERRILQPSLRKISFNTFYCNLSSNFHQYFARAHTCVLLWILCAVELGICWIFQTFKSSWVMQQLLEIAIANFQVINHFIIFIIIYIIFSIYPYVVFHLVC